MCNFPCNSQKPDDNFHQYPVYPGAIQQQPVYPGAVYSPAPIGNQFPTGLPVGQNITPPPAIPAPIGNQLPTGLPVGQNMTPPPAIPGIIVTDSMPQSVQSIAFTPGFLRTLIGKRIRVEFLIGTNGPLIDRTGLLVMVGASYIVIRLAESDDLQMCDLFSIKFVTIYK